MKTTLKAKIAAVALGVLAVGGTVALTAPSSHASTLSCTSTTSCGGADLAYTGKGNLSLAVLSPDNTINGGFGYNNEQVGFTTSGATNGTQDFTVFQDSTEPGIAQGGVYGHGNYVVMYTPGGHEANLDSNQLQYCVSVEDTYPTVGGKVVQRWSLVLRNCDATGHTSFYANGNEGLSGEKVVSHPNPYQLWAPTEVPGPNLEFQDVALNSTSFKHGFSAGKNFVMDDRAWGGSGTWGLAYPENDQQNQKFTIIGCSAPVTAFNTAYYDCAGVA